MASMSTVETRVCYRCKVERPIQMFYLGIEKRRSLRDGRQDWRMHCRICQQAKNAAHRKPRQDYVEQIKAGSGCADCGLLMPEHPEVFDFDHIDSRVKSANVSTFLTKGTMDDLRAEITKCEVVCANCHRIRTRSRESVKFGRSRT